MSGDAGQLARDRTINVLHDIKICGEEDVKVALVDLESYLAQ
jgi:hypothetical protein